MAFKINNFRNPWVFYFTFLLMSTLLMACGGNGGGDDVAGGGGGGPNPPQDTTAPTVSKTSPNSGVAITAGDSIVITFDETIDTTSLVLGGDMATESDGGIFSKPVSGPSIHMKETNDTLTISPQSEWSFGNDRTLTIDAKDLSGNSLQTLNLILNIVEGMVYVSTTGDDNNDGTKDSPMATIPAAIAEAQNLGYNVNLHGAVLVSQGTYTVNSGLNPPTHVVLSEGISLYGGYSADFSQRDSTVNTTIIEDTSQAVGSFSSPNRTVDAGSGITEVTVVDGFTIRGGNNLSSGIFNDNGASPTVQHNTINGGNGARSSIGILIRLSSSPIIHNNTINGGSGSVSYGIFTLVSTPTIQNNSINGGSGTQSFGIYNDVFTSPIIQNNSIDGGSGSTSYGIYNLIDSKPTIQNNTINGGGGSSSHGIYNDTDSSPIIQNNTINGGVGSNSYGILNLSISTTIQNNIIITSGNSSNRICIFGQVLFPTVLQNNDLFDCPDDNTISNLPEPQGNISIDPAFADRTGEDYHLTSSSPIKVTQGGLDLSTNFSTDKDGNTRTDPWSMGAYEQD